MSGFIRVFPGHHTRPRPGCCRNFLRDGPSNFCPASFTAYPPPSPWQVRSLQSTNCSAPECIHHWPLKRGLGHREDSIRLGRNCGAWYGDCSGSCAIDGNSRIRGGSRRGLAFAVRLASRRQGIRHLRPLPKPTQSVRLLFHREAIVA